MLLTIRPQLGEIPRASKEQQPEIAQQADFCNFDRGHLRPFYADSVELAAIPETGTIRTICKIGDKWVCFNDDVDVIRAQVSDLTDRNIFLYTDGASYPKISESSQLNASDGYEPASYRRLGVVAPSQATGVTIGGTGSGTKEATVAYVYTYVTDDGHESGISPVSDVRDVEGGEYTTLTIPSAPPAFAVTGNNVTHFRIYRASLTASGQAVYRLTKVRPGATGNAAVYDVPVANLTIYDCNSSVDGLSLEQDETLLTKDWEPPVMGLKGLIQFQNGIVAGFKGNKVYVSEVGYFYAFPSGYALEFEYNVVALGTYKDSLIVATEGYPYVVTGSDSRMLNKKKIDELLPCVSKRGLVSTPMGVFYPSNDGLVYCDGFKAGVVTEGLFTAEQWRDLGPESFVAVYWKGYYVAKEEGTTAYGVMFPVDGRTPSAVGVAPHQVSSERALYVCPDDGALYFVGWNGTSYSIVKTEGDTSARKDFIWRSGLIRTLPMSFAVCKVVGEFAAGTDVDVYLYGETTDDLVHSETVTSTGWFYLPGGAKREVHSIMLKGTAEVKAVLLAHNPKELVYGS